MRKQLTLEEVAEVSLVTKGESYEHRRWPEEVVRAFASAEVVTARRPQRRAAERPRPSLVHLTRLLRLG